MLESDVDPSPAIEPPPPRLTEIVPPPRGYEPPVVAMIGRTPLVPLRRFTAEAGLPRSVELRLKAEWTNPGGSIKDRAALGIVRAGLASGALARGKTLLDATSGNTGIAYAMLGAAFGFPVELVVPASASEERQQLLTAYGATVRLSDPYDGSNGAIRLARQIADADPDRYWYANQYFNPANPAAHAATTGPELWRQTEGQISHLVAGLGTTGTLIGTGRFLRARNPRITLVGVQPNDAFHGIEGLKHLPTAIVPGIYDPSLPDRQFLIKTETAYATIRELARREGLLAGISTGAALAAAVRVGRELADRGQSGMIVVIAPDGGGRYLSTGVWGESTGIDGAEKGQSDERGGNHGPGANTVAPVHQW